MWISTEWRGEWPGAVQAEVARAVEYVGTIITGSPAGDFALRCETGRIDGGSRVLAQGGPIGAVFVDGAPVATAGALRLDVADVPSMMAKGNLAEVVVHEALHAMGFGTFFQMRGLVELYDGPPRFTGPLASLAFREGFPALAQAFGAEGVPLAISGGAGSVGSHWHETILGAELMTPRANGSLWLAPFSVAAMEDIGFETVFDAGAPARPMPQVDDFRPDEPEPETAPAPEPRPEPAPPPPDVAPRGRTRTRVSTDARRWWRSRRGRR